MPAFTTSFLVGRVRDPTKIDYRRKFGYPYSNLSTGGPSLFSPVGFEWNLSPLDAFVDFSFSFFPDFFQGLRQI